MEDAETKDTAAPRKRHAAGEDPRKRAQILEGAWHVFMTQGFDAASMNSICKAAGVSKGTLYVYFEHKEDLFLALVEEKRAAYFRGLDAILAGPSSLDEALTAYGTAMVRLLTSDEVIRAQRIIIGVGERMPELAGRFWEAGAATSLRTLADWLRRQEADGRLAMADAEQAAQFFIDMSMAGFWRRRLFGQVATPPSSEQVRSNVAEVVRVFLAAYGTGKV